MKEFDSTFPKKSVFAASDLVQQRQEYFQRYLESLTSNEDLIDSLEMQVFFPFVPRLRFREGLFESE